MKDIHWKDIRNILFNYMIIIPVLTLIIYMFNLLSNIEIGKTKEIFIEEQIQRTKVIDYIIEDIFYKMNEDLLVIQNSNEVFEYTNEPSLENREEVEALFLRFGKNKNNLDQIKLINKNGYEIIGVNAGKGNPYIVNKNELENDAQRDYYIETSKLKKGESYISPFNLNIKNDVVEIPYKPIIKVATPLYSKDEKYQGILVINYLGQDLLNVFGEEFNDKNYRLISPCLINEDGYYLYNIDFNKNFAFMFKEKNNYKLSLENPVLWKEIKSKETGYLENDYEITYFMKINPFGKIKTRKDFEYCWYIISRANLESLPLIADNIVFGMKTTDIFILIALSLLILIIVIAMYCSKKDKEQLNITNKIADNTNDAVIITDNNIKIIYVNKAFERISGYKKEEILGLNPSCLKSNKQTAEFYKEMWNNINSKGYWIGELWDRKKDGLLYPKKLSIIAMKDNKMKKSVKYLGIFSDLTKVMAEEEYVEILKNYNLDTSLPNEKLLFSLINNSIKGYDENLYIIYFIVKNINNIVINTKRENQYFINYLINLIKKMINEEDFIAQISEEKFVLGLLSFKEKSEVDNFLKKFFAKTRGIVCYNGRELYFEIKAGISVYPKDGILPEELIVNANIALEQVLNEKDKDYLYFRVSLKDIIEEEVKINLLLRKAISNNEFDVYYQPQIEIEREKVVGVEALIRWKNKELGFISPSVFIPIAEKTGLIIEIGYFVLERVFSDYAEIKKHLGFDFRISINLSPLQFKDIELITKFKDLANKYNVDFKNIEIEITESLLMTDFNQVNKDLNKFKELGITIAIDDFGTGYSSLNYIRNLNVDKLKIDRSFIKDYPEKDSGDIAQVITNMASKLKLKVITEGVETKEQVEYLKAIGCNLIQGYFYSHPLNKDQLYKYLKVQ